MSKFKVGQKVVRVTEWFCNNPMYLGKPIQKGEMLTVRHIIDDKGLRFEEIRNPNTACGTEFGYNIEDFEPVTESSTEFVEVTFTKIIESTPKICAS
jgi:hypothetical protein